MALYRVISLLLALVQDAFRFLLLGTHSKAALKGENLFLRKQLALYLEREVKPRRASDATRLSMALLSRLFAWPEALVSVKPETLVGWHRKNPRSGQASVLSFHPQPPSRPKRHGCSSRWGKPKYAHAEEMVGHRSPKNKAVLSCDWCDIESTLATALWLLNTNKEMSLTNPRAVGPLVSSSSSSDNELIRLVASGRQDALTVLFDRYHRLVFSVALRIVRDPGEAEDVVQIVFLDLFRASANFDPMKGSLKVWILQYAYHRALHRKRHLLANHFYRWEDIEAAIEVGSHRALSGEFPEAARLAQQMLEKLKPRQRKVMEMTYFEGFTAEEIAGRLDETTHTVRHDLHRGLAALRKSVKSKT